MGLSQQRGGAIAPPLNFDRERSSLPDLARGDEGNDPCDRQQRKSQLDKASEESEQDDARKEHQRKEHSEEAPGQPDGKAEQSAEDCDHHDREEKIQHFRTSFARPSALSYLKFSAGQVWNKRWLWQNTMV